MSLHGALPIVGRSGGASSVPTSLKPLVVQRCFLGAQCRPGAADGVGRNGTAPFAGCAPPTPLVTLGLDPRVQGKRRSGHPGCSGRSPSMTILNVVRVGQSLRLSPSASEPAARVVARA